MIQALVIIGGTILNSPIELNQSISEWIIM